MPAPPIDERTQYGGQAVVEGVMMRSPRFFAIACRRLSDQKIVLKLEPVEKHVGAFQWLNKPFLRGSLALVDAMALGIKALTYAANVQATDEFAKNEYAKNEAASAGAVNMAMGEGVAEKTKSSDGTITDGTINGIAIGATTVLSLFLGFALFWTFPALLTDKLLPHHGRLLSNLTEGAIRLAIFFTYIGLISQMKHIQRVFQYHGAEHKAINTLERRVPMTVENARESSRIHPRCGTNFIFIVLVTSIAVFSVVPRHAFSEGILPVLSTVFYRLLLLPIVAGVAYEILKWAGQNRDKAWAQALIAPGLWTQYLTTRVPDDSQLEVAIASLDAVWAEEHGGTGLISVPAGHPGEEPEPVIA